MIRAKRNRLFPALALAGAFLCALAGCGPARSSVDFTGAGGKRVALRALSGEARRGRLALPSSNAWFSFDAVKAGIPESATARGGRGAIEVTIVREGDSRSAFGSPDAGEPAASAAPAPFAKFSLALVGAKDLSAEGYLAADVGSRDLSTVVTDASTVRISMTIPDSGDFASVAGFAVSISGSADARFRIASAAVVPATAGWESGSDSFLASFGPSGGSIDSREAASSPVAFYPGSVARVSLAASDPGTIDDQNRVVFSVGRTTVGFRASPVPYRAYLPSALAQAAFSPSAGAEPVTARALAGARSVRGFLVERNAPYALTTTVASPKGKPAAGKPVTGKPVPAHAGAPILADPHMIIEWPQDAWRNEEYELFAWDRFPSVLVFDTANYAVQDRLFKRLAFFAEKDGFRGTLADDASLSGLHAYNAHDYRADTLAAFFELARTSSFQLGPEELALRDVLAGEGVIRKDGESWVAGAGAVLSISRESVSYLRYLFMAHEGYHGIYFVDPDYRAEVSSVYASMDARAIEFLESYFTVVDTLGYDRADRYLMENEFMGYLMQQGEAKVAQYFTGTITERFLRYGGDPALADYIAKTDASDFTRAAHELGSYAFARWGITGGRVGLYFFD